MAKVSLRAYNREIESMIDQGHLDEAVAHCQHILKTFPKHLETYRLLGKTYLEYKRFADAVDIFLRVLLAVPNDFVAHVGMSIVRDEEDKLDEAIWHMERAFETQPSNSAIQSELQRLYGRRDGVQPPRIRMTRGALAQMYVQGELYPQAISEIKSVLKEDPAREDMQVLLARASYRSGSKNEAADVASAVLRKNPYSLDANRVLVEILGADHPEGVQAYRQRVFELDPYAAHVTGTVFSSAEVPDMAISLEHLDWNGQPVGAQPDWESTQAPGLESGLKQDAEPDWLRNTPNETPAPASLLGHPTPASAFDMSAPPPATAEPAEGIPDFLRAAGWGQSTGAFDESKSMFVQDEPASTAQPIEQGDLPDWVKAMAPPEPAATPQEEELPDWINKIGTSALPDSSAPEAGDQPAAQPAGDQPDWLTPLSQSEQPVSTASEDQPDWLTGFANESESTSASSTTDPLDWLNQPVALPETPLAETSTNEFDFLSQAPDQLETAPAAPASSEFDLPAEVTQPENTLSTASSDKFDFLNEMQGQPETALSSAADFDFLDELPEKPESPVSAPLPETSTMDTGNLGTSDQERDDSFAWLENLAARQGASEGLLTKPEERLQEEPEWVKQAKGMNMSQPPAQETPAAPPSGNLEELGKSDQERDDSFAWLENLAAKQGASEGLLTKPEERLEQEPDWIRQAKSLSNQTPQTMPPPTPIEEAPVASELFESLTGPAPVESQLDDSSALDADVNLFTKPAEPLETETEWMDQVQDLDAEQPSSSAVAEQPSVIDDTAAWLRSLDEEESAPAPSSRVANDDTAMWLKSLDQPEVIPSQPVQSEQSDDLPAWMQNIKEDKPTEEIRPPISTSDIVPDSNETDAVEESEWMSATEQPAVPSAVPVQESPTSEAESLPSWLDELDEEEVQPSTPIAGEDLPTWMKNIEDEKPTEETASSISAREVVAEIPETQAAAEPERTAETEQPAVQSFASVQETPTSEAEGIPGWLNELDDEEEAQISTPTAGDDLPAWLRDETGEVIAEPTRIQPTRADDWQRVEAEASEAEEMPVATASQESEPETSAAVGEATIEEIPEPAASVPQVEKPVATEPEPYEEPATRAGAGMVTMTADPLLGQARNELSDSNLPAALESYARLIKKGSFLDEVINDLREASYRYPVDVDLWQSLGDAYMRADHLQDALDAYTKAEELLR